MGVFDSSNDTPNQLKHEGDSIAVKFLPGAPQQGQGTVNWNIPAPMLGCASDSPGAYCGIVFLLAMRPFTPEDMPVDGVRYEADPTADPDVHAGDEINGALVIGAFYEGEKKARGEDLTTSFTISNVDSRGNYYVIGYAVDCQGRYHKTGQRAYSDEFGDVEEPGTPGYQTIVLNDGAGALATDGTGLVAGMIYELEMEINPEFPDTSKTRVVKLREDGIDLATYGDVADAMNKAIALAENPIQSPVQPNQGRYYWTGGNLYQWDGSENQPIDIINEPSDPSTVTNGTYWYDPDTKQLQQYTTAWAPVDTIAYHRDPTSLTADDFWYPGAGTAYRWCDSTWCEEIIHDQATDPTTQPVPNCSVFWYDETASALRNWSHDFQAWEIVYAIAWDVAPTALANGTYWFNDTDDTLYQYDGANFNAVVYIDSEEEPTGAADGDLWYNGTLEELKQYVLATTSWVDVPVLVWLEDPRNTESCDLWWDITTDRLYKWDVVHSEWDEVGEFTLSPEDPYSAPVVTYGEMWYNSTSGEMKRWDGASWIDITWIDYPIDPTLPALGTAWHDTANDKWYIWDTPVAGWNEINPVDVVSDPQTIANGAIWYDSTNDTLFERQGAAWIALPFSTTSFVPMHGDKWFDTTDDVLYEWVRNPDRNPNDPTSKQGEWVKATPLAITHIDRDGHLTTYTTGTGSNQMVMILIPEGTEYATYEGLATGDAGLDTICCHYDDYQGVAVPATSVGPDTFIFSYFTPRGGIKHHQYGNDAIHQLPSYQQLDVGTDGSPDERREIADWVRSQLGYPVVEVELTTKQLDESIDFALETLRQRTSIAYQRNAFFLDIVPGKQHYIMTDRVCGFHKIVTIMSAHRFTSAFLSTAHGAGVYGQIVLQHLYNMGTFDLLSYHLVSEYVEQLEHLFATRLVFHWNESERMLSFYQSFTVPERVLLDVTIERTEQSILKDRWVRTWVKRFALMRGMETLAQIRGKYATLPGAGGGVSLNAADLITRASELREELNMEIEDYISNDPEDIGMHSSFIMG